MSTAGQERYLGGQAVMEGVMMRGPDTWAVAVRTPDGGIDIAVHEAPVWAERWAKWPLVRGVMNLAESTALGFKALSWSSARQLPEDERLSSTATNWTMAVAAVVFTAIFIVLPALVNRGLASLVGVEGIWFHLMEGGVRLGVFLTYLLGMGMVPDIKRVFQYHGAEHKAIAAYENGAEMSTEAAQRYSTAHVRCGTNFLLTVMVVTIVVYSFVGRPSLAVLLASRVILIPLVAGLAYEVIRFAARHMDQAWVRALMRPGLLLQRVTTREPSDDQVAVAIAALRAALSAEQRAEVDRRARIKAPVSVDGT